MKGSPVRVRASASTDLQGKALASMSLRGRAFSNTSLQMRVPTFPVEKSHLQGFLLPQARERLLAVNEGLSRQSKEGSPVSGLIL